MGVADLVPQQADFGFRIQVERFGRPQVVHTQGDGSYVVFRLAVGPYRKAAADIHKAGDDATVDHGTLGVAYELILVGDEQADAIFSQMVHPDAEQEMEGEFVFDEVVKRGVVHDGILF